MKTIAEIFTFLETQENGSEIINTIKSEINKNNNENKNLRTRLREEESKVKTIREKLQLSDEDDLSQGLESVLSNSKKPADEITKQLKTFETKFKELEEAKKKSDELASNRLEKAKKMEIINILNECKAIKPDFIAKVLKDNVKANEDETFSFLNDDGSEIALKDGIKAFLETNTEFVANPATAGSGSSTTTNNNNQTQKTEFAKMAERSQATQVSQDTFKDFTK